MNQNYSIKELTEEEFWPLFDRHKQSVFQDTHSCDLKDVLTDIELHQVKKLGRETGTPFKLYLGIFDKDNEFVGWSWGYQESGWTFYMVNSAILKEHRRRGLYVALLEKCIEILGGKGFQLIYSRHCATNNAVIIPKLKTGFIISKMEIDDRFGILIHLHFYTNIKRRRIMDYRAGQLRPDTQIKEIFKI